MDFLSEVVVTNCGGAMGTAVGNAFAQSNGNPKLGFIRTGDEHIHVSASSEFSLRSFVSLRSAHGREIRVIAIDDQIVAEVV
jgi:hypothetical protein